METPAIVIVTIGRKVNRSELSVIEVQNRGAGEREQHRGMRRHNKLGNFLGGVLVKDGEERQLALR